MIMIILDSPRFVKNMCYQIHDEQTVELVLRSEHSLAGCSTLILWMCTSNCSLKERK